MTPASENRLRFGPFEFDPETGELWRRGHVIHLPPKPASVLAVLLERPGRLVTRAHLHGALWSGLSGSSDRNLNYAVRQIRTALNDRAENPAYVETVPRQGYRFIAPVHPAGAEKPAAHVPSRPDAGRRTKRWLVGAAAGVPVILFTAWSLAASDPQTPQATAQRRTLAIVPFDVLSSADTIGFFASGLHRALTSRLATIDPTHLGVVERPGGAALGAHRGDPVAIGRDFGVEQVLTGSVQPGTDGVHVSVQLTASADGIVRWTEEYIDSTADWVSLQHRIAADVVRSLLPETTSNTANRVPRRASNTDARSKLSEGNYRLNRRAPGDVSRAVTLFEQAIELDPHHAPSFAALGRAYAALNSWEEARRSFEKSLELDPDLADSHAALGMDAMSGRWDFPTARQHFTKALELAPGSAYGHRNYAYYLSYTAQHDDAVRHMKIALELDPVSPYIHGDVGRIYYRAHRFEEAKTKCLQTSALFPRDGQAISCLLNLAMLGENFDEAQKHATKLMEQSGATSDEVEVVRSAEAREGARGYWRWRVSDLTRRAAAGEDTQVPLAQAHVWLGEFDQALTALENAFAARSRILIQVAGDPCFERLSNMPRYQHVMQQIFRSAD